MTVTIKLAIGQAVAVAGILGEHRSPGGYDQSYQVYRQLLNNLPADIQEDLLGLPDEEPGREWPTGLTNLVQKVSK